MENNNKKYYNLQVSQVLGFLKNYDSFALFDTSLCDSENYRSVICYDLCERIQIEDFSEIKEKIDTVEKITKSGYHAVCVIPYEAGLALEPSCGYKEKLPYPCVFLFFKKNLIFNHNSGEFLEDIPDDFLLKSVNTRWAMKRLWFDTHYREYSGKIKKIKYLIEQGETYQVNYTIRCRFNFSGSVFGMYLDLRERQRVPYSALIRCNDHFILSFSPELFFRKQDNLIKVRPMKGTIKRGKNQSQDKRYKNNLSNSIKNKAENLMIVDMMRNDLGKICVYGSVVTESLFQIEKYETLYQMTSTIKGTLKKNIKFSDIIKAIFPSASITGAPKIRTMQIISELEKSHRKIYTGTIGILYPDNSAVFNVAIRTILIKKNLGEMGVGGGIVYDSKPDKEYLECLLKSAFLVSACKKIQLIETMRWSKKEGYFLLDLHLKRLQKSAEFFKFEYNRKKIISLLEKLTSNFDPDNIYKIRLLLFQNGSISISFQKIDFLNLEKQKTSISNRKIDPENLFLYHKTTVRDIYEHTYKKAIENGYFDIIFENKFGEITEGCITNIFVEKNGILYTPPISCGLLPGILREYLIKKNVAKEKIITKNEIFSADKIYLGNSVRGLIQVSIEAQKNFKNTTDQ
ncbi:MAG TPA: aminodeoxychorismate synthase component I [Candidatus Ratteibacteria bacterium]|nr:aminodeoxychorismate synthase component I [Candidatus Ratteibacteria bacterium]HRV03960.1 aminodeoxychorismate synthase component I [Candidatus Ratteibacteria bacterium]